jgi:hypothetical protein
VNGNIIFDHGNIYDIKAQEVDYYEWKNCSGFSWC